MKEFEHWVLDMANSIEDTTWTGQCLDAFNINKPNQETKEFINKHSKLPSLVLQHLSKNQPNMIFNFLGYLDHKFGANYYFVQKINKLSNNVKVPTRSFYAITYDKIKDEILNIRPWSLPLMRHIEKNKDYVKLKEIQFF